MTACQTAVEPNVVPTSLKSSACVFSFASLDVIYYAFTSPSISWEFVNGAIGRVVLWKMVGISLYFSIIFYLTRCRGSIQIHCSAAFELSSFPFVAYKGPHHTTLSADFSRRISIDCRL